METLSENACFGGVQGVYRHTSSACSCDMTFGLFLPEETRDGPVPVLWSQPSHGLSRCRSGAPAWRVPCG